MQESSVRCEGMAFFLAHARATFQELFHIPLRVPLRYAGVGFRQMVDGDGDAGEAGLGHQTDPGGV